jgi:manganese/iron transport system permease protein
MLDFLLAPLQYDFMIHGMLAAVLVGILCAVIGCFIVLRSMAFLGDAMAHAVLPGVAVAYLFGGNLILGALIAALIVAGGIALFSRRGTLREDTAIGILFSSALALGVAIISTMRTYAVDLSHILFGNVLGVSTSDVWVILGLGLFVLALLLLAYRPLVIVSFDPVLATTLRLPVEGLRSLLLVLVAVTIVVSIQTVGVGLVTAMLITPAATAYLLTRRLSSMMLLAGFLGALSGVIGLYASYYANLASGAAVVLAATVFFLIAFLFSPQRGWVANQWRKNHLDS